MAFTLIELLAVIAIISSLAAILVPAIKVVKASSESSSCQNNQRQIHLALMSYAQDNDDFIPTGQTYPTNTNYASYDNLLSQYDGRNLTNVYAIPSAVDPKTLKIWNMYRCPSEKDILTNDAWLTGAGGAIRFYRSYALNGATVSSVLKGLYATAPSVAGSVGTSYPYAVIAKPSNTILIAETRYLNAYTGARGGETVDFPNQQMDARVSSNTLHRTKWNYLFADGHMATLLATDTTSPGASMNTTTATGMWWR